AFTLWEMLKRRHPEQDLYRLVRTGDEGFGISATTLTEKVLAVWLALSARAERGELHLESGVVASGDAATILRTALRHFGTYHTHPVMVRKGDRIFCEDMKLLHYYS